MLHNPEHNNHTYTFSFLPDHAAALPKEFYKNYSEVFALPYNMTDRTFAEYAGNPDSRVEIHYWFGESSNEYTEILSSCGGYFVK